MAPLFGQKMRPNANLWSAFRSEGDPEPLPHLRPKVVQVRHIAELPREGGTPTTHEIEALGIVTPYKSPHSFAE